MRRLTLLVCLSAMCGSAALAATASASDTTPVTFNECNAYLRSFRSDVKPPSGLPGFGPRVNYNSTTAISNAVYCYILLSRKARGLKMPTRNAVLKQSSLGHATASANAHSWDLHNGTVSHLNPGTPVPGDQDTLQKLANQQIDGRIRGAGYCANGSSYADSEVTYANPGNRQVAAPGANQFWRTDPPHAVVYYDPKWTDIGISVVSPSAFPGQTTGYTFVVDLGTCK